jgi:hypothetical protein
MKAADPSFGSRQATPMLGEAVPQAMLHTGEKHAPGARLALEHSVTKVTSADRIASIA